MQTVAGIDSKRWLCFHFSDCLVSKHLILNSHFAHIFRSLTMANVQKQLVVFDFDWCVCSLHDCIFLRRFRSLADQDTDRWVFEVLAPDLRRKMKTLKDDVQWTDLM